MPVPVEEVVGAALASTELAEVCGRVLEVVRTELDADAALFVRSGPPAEASVAEGHIGVR